ERVEGARRGRRGAPDVVLVVLVVDDRLGDGAGATLAHEARDRLLVRVVPLLICLARVVEVGRLGRERLFPAGPLALQLLIDHPLDRGLPLDRAGAVEPGALALTLAHLRV